MSGNLQDQLDASKKQASELQKQLSVNEGVVNDLQTNITRLEKEGSDPNEALVKQVEDLKHELEQKKIDMESKQISGYKPGTHKYKSQKRVL